MFSITFKRSAATLGVAAGLLAAAGPASAQVMPGVIGVKAPTKAGTQVGHEGHNAVLIQRHDHQNALVKAPSKATDPSGAVASFTLDVASSEVFELNTFGLTEHEGAAFRGEVTGLEPNALGTQVGSEGVKAPTTPTANGFIIDFAHTDLMARTLASTDVRSEDVNAVLDTGMFEHEWVKAPTNAGTQIGFED